MPTFDTPEPISVVIDIPVGTVRVDASARTDTIVTVRQGSESAKTAVGKYVGRYLNRYLGNPSESDAAERTTVDYTEGRLLIKVPADRGLHSLLGASGSVDIDIALPSGSSIKAEAAWTEFRGSGRLGQCKFTSAGDIRLDETGPLTVHSGAGDVIVNSTSGNAMIETATGEVRIGKIAGSAVVKNGSGDCWVGEVTGAATLNTAAGDITVERAHGDVEARTATGGVTVGEVRRGSIVLETAYGAVNIGIHNGTAAWLDVGSSYGGVDNKVDSSDGPSGAEETAEIRAHTQYGDIMIRRSR
ncbi:hypothetical protein BAY61_27185 [Prauserella marina]|uniref:Putative adhesin n=1 Tax=Prauserella marina TaxID=530584 RepID=A0A222VW75_9PSEU|nr:DUF4097 family beta strand repeat-containing protein [Prauserella marina]ASR38082.1 hypothetical protein BAY61_27185 [Prauserella marina]PWV78764.1 putative adhesin [Prauserella marina]SDC93093.1 Putative adhesin [Prauserella marina]